VHHGAARLRIFKNAWFDRFARKERIGDRALREAVQRAEKGQIDADLGGGVLKQRVARPGEGRSKGYRTIVLFRRGERAVFVYGFSKSVRANIRRDEEYQFKKAAKYVLALSDEQIGALIGQGGLSEVGGDADGEEVSQ
jgi:hypothetical protein